MSKKSVAKRYLLYELLLYVGGVLFLGAFALAAASRQSVALTTAQAWQIAFLCPLLPCSSFAGFVLAFLRVSELTKRQMIAVVVLFPLLLVILTVGGAVLLLPSMVYYTIALFKKS